jgi:glycosyltransferase involved in cell wall biosynthesis
LRILILSQYFWPESFRINDLALALVERGHSVTVLTGVPNYPRGRFHDGYGFFRPREETLGGVRVLRVPLLPRGTNGGWRLAANYLSFTVSASILGPLRCREPYDVLFVYEPSPVLVGIPAAVLRRLKRVPMLFWVQDLWPESLSATGAVTSPALLRAVARVARWIYRRCDRVLVQSRGFVDRVVGVGADPGRVRYLANWAEAFYTPLELPADAPERAEVPEGFRVMFAGNIGKAQSLETVVEAAKELRDIGDLHWVIVGDGHRRPWLEAEVKAHGLEKTVHLLGPRPVTSMPRYLALGDALLVTLRRDPIFELTIPTKLQSYLACGRPVVAALDGEGARVVLEAGAGETCPAEDAAALAAAVRRVYGASAEERRQLGARGRAYFEAHFERERLVTRTEELMDEAVRERAACAS